MTAPTPPLPLSETLVFSPVLLLHQHYRLCSSSALFLICSRDMSFSGQSKGEREREGSPLAAHSSHGPQVLLLSLPWTPAGISLGSSSIHLLSYNLAFTLQKRKSDHVTPLRSTLQWFPTVLRMRSYPVLWLTSIWFYFDKSELVETLKKYKAPFPHPHQEANRFCQCQTAGGRSVSSAQSG